MKAKFFYPFVLLLIVSACSDPQAKARKSIEAYLQTKLNDPKSYEFVSIDSLKPITRADSLLGAQLDEELAVMNSFDYDKEKHRLNVLYDYSIPAAEYENMGKKLADVQARDSAVKVKYTKLITPETKTVTTGYHVKMKFRSKNGMGALTLGEYNFTLDNNFAVLNASSTKD